MGTTGIEENAKSTHFFPKLDYTTYFLYKFDLSLLLFSPPLPLPQLFYTGISENTLFWVMSTLLLHFDTILSSHPSIRNNIISANLWESHECLTIILAFAEPVSTPWSGMDSQGISHSGPISMSALLITVY